MRYHYEKPLYFKNTYGIVYKCPHTVYTYCTLFKIGDIGLAVIQQRYISETKHTYWGPIDEWLCNELYLHPEFKNYFDKYAKECRDGLYPTVTIRQIMWGLKMKPIKREPWETAFDHAPI